MRGCGGWKEEKETWPRALERSTPWVSVAAGVQTHVCGCCLVLYNKLLRVREVAGGGEPSASRGRRGEAAAGRSPGEREGRRVGASEPGRSTDFTALSGVSRGRHEHFAPLLSAGRNVITSPHFPLPVVKSPALEAVIVQQSTPQFFRLEK